MVTCAESTRSRRSRHVRFAPIATKFGQRSETSFSANRVVTRCSKCALFSANYFWALGWLLAPRRRTVNTGLARDGHVGAHYARELAPICPFGAKGWHIAFALHGKLV